MLRKALTLGMVFILALSLLAVSMITCFTYDAEAGELKFGHIHYECTDGNDTVRDLHHRRPGWSCFAYTQQNQAFLLC